VLHKPLLIKLAFNILVNKYTIVVNLVLVIVQLQNSTLNQLLNTEQHEREEAPKKGLNARLAV